MKFSPPTNVKKFFVHSWRKKADGLLDATVTVDGKDFIFTDPTEIASFLRSMKPAGGTWEGTPGFFAAEFDRITK